MPVAVGRTAGAVGGLADSGLMVRLTRGRLWIGLLATLLVGIVGLNVVALSFNARSSESASRAETLQQRNSALRAQLASQLSTDELQTVAVELDLLSPAPGAIRYLRPGADDAQEAAKRLRSGDLTSVDSAPIVPVATDAVASAPVADAATTPTETAVVEPADTDPAVAEPAATEPATDTAVDPVAASGAVAAP
jgi:hypothetical protein